MDNNTPLVSIAVGSLFIAVALNELYRMIRSELASKERDVVGTLSAPTLSPARTQIDSDRHVPTQNETLITDETSASQTNDVDSECSVSDVHPESSTFESLASPVTISDVESPNVDIADGHVFPEKNIGAFTSERPDYSAVKRILEPRAHGADSNSRPDTADEYKPESNPELAVVRDAILYNTSPLFIQTNSSMAALAHVRKLLSGVHTQIHVCTADEQSAHRNAVASIFDMFNLSRDARNVERLVYRRSSSRSVLDNLTCLVILDAQALDPATVTALEHRLQRAHANENSFGGVRVVFIGDPFLPGRSLNDEELAFVLNSYNSRSFLDAPCVLQANVQLLSCTFPLPRKSSSLQRILTDYRMGRLRGDDMNVGKPVDLSVQVTASAQKATAINNVVLDGLSGKRHVFECIRVPAVHTDYPPCPEQLCIVSGVRVVFLTNDPEYRWHRGSTGTVSSFTDDAVVVQIDGGVEASVERYTWKTPMYHGDPYVDVSTSESYQSFRQFPLMLGWAISAMDTIDMTIPNVYVHDSLLARQDPMLLYLALQSATDPQSIVWEKKPTFSAAS